LGFGFSLPRVCALDAGCGSCHTLRQPTRENPKLTTRSPEPARRAAAGARMIRSFIFSDGKLVGQDLELEALRLVRADKGLLLWVDLDNPTAEEIKAILENVFQFHPLAIEDCVQPSSLPKVEDYEDYLFIVAHAVDFTRTEKFNTTELDFFLGRDYVVTFHTSPLRSVSALMERTTKSAGVGPRGPDRIVHTLIDMLVDNYAPVIDELRAELEELEEHVLARASGQQKLVNELLHVRGDFTRLRTIVRPQRDVIDRLARGDSKLIRPKLLPYFRDLRDNLVRLEDTAAGYHERLLMAFDIYLNKASFEASEGIKFLTAITALTIPIMAIGTWYGMNFTTMRELEFGYPWAAGVTLVLTLLMFVYLRKKKWF
jgi:magnesium transporter